MKKLIQGILDFKRNMPPGYRATFAQLALGQSPDTLFIACSDSRVVPNLFASTNPGDLFVVRNVGNLVPPSNDEAELESEAAAIEFAVSQLKVSDIVVCGHSDCGAMHAIYHGLDKVESKHLRHWLSYGQPAMDKIKGGERFASVLAPFNELSQVNVLQQIQHIKSYDAVKRRLKAGDLRIHAWWFELSLANVYIYDSKVKAFILLDEYSAELMLARAED